MKHLLPCLLLLISTPCLAQYRGGSNDGIAQIAASAQNPLPDIYKGGNNDGQSVLLASNQNALPGIYVGGSNDGIAAVTIAGHNALPGIYSGGTNDGVAAINVAGQNPLAPIYTGGANDGVAFVSAPAQNALPAIYLGGANDGVSALLVAVQNALPDIYKGGGNDGHSFIVKLNQNPSFALPVTLLEFVGDWFNDDAVLAWRIINDKSLDHFELERSNEGGDFVSIANILPNADPAQQDYRHNDLHAYYLPHNFLLYRLKIVERSGTRYSAIVRLSMDKSLPAIAAYPNPTSGRVTVAVMNVTDFSGYAYIITAADGKLVTHGDIREKITTLSLSGLPAANYHLSLFKEGKLIQHFSILLTP